MKDRIPTPGQEGRMLITPENGDPPFYATVAMADNPSEDGTPLHKATLLKDATAALFGLDNTAVPDDVLAWLGKYNQHWWSVLHGQAAVRYDEKKTLGTDMQFLYCQPADYASTTVQYADEIEIDQSTGAITLVNPNSIQFTYNLSQSVRVNRLKTLYGKYAKGIPELGDNSTATSTDVSSKVFFVPEGASYFAPSDGSTAGFNPQSFYTVTAQVVNVPAGETTFVHSADRNAYPDSGTVDGLTYTYLGVPFDKSVTAPRLAVGSYMGTGTYGADNPTSLTFEFEPQLLFVFPNDSWLFNGNMRLTAVRGQVATSLRDSGSSSVYIPVVLNWDGKTVSWYTALGEMDAVSGADQLNAGNAEYFYAALG